MASIQTVDGNELKSFNWFPVSLPAPNRWLARRLTARGWEETGVTPRDLALKDPAGPSSLSTYQTGWAFFSFDQADQRLNTGQESGLCTGTLLKTLPYESWLEDSGMTDFFRQPQGARHAETVIVVTIVRVVVIADGRPHVVCVIVERPATQHAAFRPSPTGKRL